MAKLYFPATFLKENDGYTVTFKDVPEAITCGNTFEEAVESAKDCLGLAFEARLHDFEEAIPKATDISKIKTEKNESLVIIEFDSLEYAKKYNKQAVKRMISIPQYLDDLANKNNISLSKLLQAALKEKLGIN